MFRLIILLSLLSIPSFADCQDYTGDWEGKLNVGPGVRIVFHIKEDGRGGLSATADSPDQNSRGYKCDSTYLTSSGIHIELRKVRAAFAGSLQGDSVIDGTFTQGAPIPLRLSRQAGSAGTTRQQDPKPPFPYRSEELVFTGKETGLTYGGTLNIPAGKGPFPSVVLITGSGQQDRDYTLMGHRPFLVLADQLARNGIMSLRVDDRGLGQSTGNFQQSTSEDFADDVSAALDYLLSRPEARRSATGLVGHSEGGMIAPIVASKRKDIAFTVLLAAPGVPIINLMTEQSGAILRSSGVGDTAVKVYAPFYTSIMKTLTGGNDSAAAINSARTYMENWASSTDTAVLRELQLNSPMARMAMFRTLAGVARNPWFRYFMTYDPTPYLEKMKMSTLVLNGSRDIQVLPESNTHAIREALTRAGNKHFEVEVIPGLNHLFQTCNDCTVAEYRDLPETFSPVALRKITDWIRKTAM